MDRSALLAMRGQMQASDRASETFHVSYAGYHSCRLSVHLGDNRTPTEVMFRIGPCLPYVQRWVAETARDCQLISVALRHGAPLKSLVTAGIKPLPAKISISRIYGSTPAPVANDLTEWVLRHLALIYLGPVECAKMGVRPGFWCPGCNNAEARCVGHNSWFCDCGWKYIN